MLGQPGEKLAQALIRLLAAARTYRERLLRFAVAEHDHVGDLLELGFSDPLADRLVALVRFRSNAGLPQPPRRSPRRARDALSCTETTRTCTGASQYGKSPAKCSIRMPMKRSNEPYRARCTT